MVLLKNKRAIGILSWLMAMIWMFLIISFSSDPAQVSREKSTAVLEKVEPVIVRMEESLKMQIVDESRLHFYVRKNAHMFNYFVLAALMTLLLRVSGVRGFRLYFLAYLIATMFSGIDEYYQTFIPGRSGELRDVMVDNVGVLVGLLAAWMIEKWREKCTFRLE